MKRIFIWILMCASFGLESAYAQSWETEKRGRGREREASYDEEQNYDRHESDARSSRKSTSQGFGFSRSASYPRYQGEVNIAYDFNLTTSASGFLAETVHGVRINQYAFAGLGIAYTGAVPIFAAARGYYPISERFAPMAWLDAGYSVAGYSGAYTSFGVGVNYGMLTAGIGWIGVFGDEGAHNVLLKVGVKF